MICSDLSDYYILEYRYLCQFSVHFATEEKKFEQIIPNIADTAIIKDTSLLPPCSNFIKFAKILHGGRDQPKTISYLLC